MSACTDCGCPLGAGRFCPRCGAAVDSMPDPAGRWHTDTAERRLLPADPPDPRTPPSAVAPPPPPRYPLYADEVAGRAPDGSLVTVAGLGLVSRTGSTPAPSATPAVVPDTIVAASYAAPYAEPYAEPVPRGDDGAGAGYVDDRRSPWLWVTIALVVLALLAAAWWYVVLAGPTDANGRTGSDPDGGASSAAADAVDVAPAATAQAPRTAKPNDDVDGARVSYDASNMLDAKPETAWRTNGDATGMALRLTLARPTELTRVGLVNGYAKTSTDDQGRTYDWYRGDRRILEVVWTFPGGRTVRQPLTETRELQTVDLDPTVKATKVVLRIATVSAPGGGTASRDFTAISEVSLVGVPRS